MKGSRPSRVGLRSADVAAAAQLACLLEVSASKPGNVSPGRHFADARYEDFLASAVAIGEPIAGAAARSVGATIRLAAEATAKWTRSNTNLGIVLLLAPLARAALLEKGVGRLFPDPAKVPPDPLFPGSGEANQTPDPFSPGGDAAKKTGNPLSRKGQAKMPLDAMSRSWGEPKKTPDPFFRALFPEINRKLTSDPLPRGGWEMTPDPFFGDGRPRSS